MTPCVTNDLNLALEDMKQRSVELPELIGEQ